MADEPKPEPPPATAAVPAPPAAPSGAPAPLERAALERVLARAAELQAAEADPGELTLTEAQILDVGNEVGIPAKHLRQALAEERSRVEVPVERGRVAALFGSATVFASRTVRGAPLALFEKLDDAMQREESLRVKRRFPDRIAWEPRGGMATEFRRIMNVGGHGYRLARAEEVSATIIAVDAERSIVRLDASLANVRSQRIAGGSGVAVAGGVTAGVLFALGVMAAVAALPVAAGLVGGYYIARSHSPQVAGAQLALEQMLDRLERGELQRPSLISGIAASAGLRWP
ncbi:MAG: hypothetical protein JWO39_782 [Gemmatimonadetes bacterium]|nr:hypothetical protein [Gemmatimonadota bacterium]